VRTRYAVLNCASVRPAMRPETGAAVGASGALTLAALVLALPLEGTAARVARAAVSPCCWRPARNAPPPAAVLLAASAVLLAVGLHAATPFLPALTNPSLVGKRELTGLLRAFVDCGVAAWGVAAGVVFARLWSLSGRVYAVHGDASGRPAGGPVVAVPSSAPAPRAPSADGLRHRATAAAGGDGLMAGLSFGAGT
jgi:hypothetical protein